MRSSRSRTPVHTPTTTRPARRSRPRWSPRPTAPRAALGAATDGAEKPQRVHATTVGIFNAGREWTAGDEVKRGDVLGGIQSLGHIAEISAPADGEIREVLVAGGAPVEYGQPLFVIALR